MYICICHGKTDTEIKEAIAEGACSVPCLAKRLGVTTQCGKCRPEVEDILEETLFIEDIDDASPSFSG